MPPFPFLATTLFVLFFCTVGRPQHVAIVGAGMGGAASAYFLRELLGNNATITVIEQSARVGGRAENVSYINTTTTVPLEIGASILYTGNEHLMTAVRTLKLHAAPPVFESEAGTSGIWDGSRLVFQSSSWSFLTAMRVLWRYGLGMFRLRRVVRQTLRKFRQIYALQGTAGSPVRVAYETPEALWGALDLLHLTKVSLRDYLASQGVGFPDSKLVTEFVGSIQRVNYNANNDLNALAGLVSLCPTVTGEVVSLTEGNAALAVSMLKAAEARVLQGVRVGEVEVVRGGAESGYRLVQDDGRLVRTEGDKEKGENEAFDVVIVATPFAFSSLRVIEREKGANDERQQASALSPPPAAFTTTHASFVQGRVRPGFFGPSTTREDRVPTSVYVVENSSVPISSLSLHVWINATERTGIYKLFSSALLTDSFLDDMFFTGWSLLHHRKWKAYPSYHPPEAMTPFLVVPGERICYVNALETAVSAMEISAIAAQNCALLLSRDFEDKMPNVDEQREKMEEL